MNERERRAWLLRRIEVEANAYPSADPLIRDLWYGRVLGLLEVGAAFGYWSKKAADAASESIAHRFRIGRIGRVVRRLERQRV